MTDLNLHLLNMSFRLRFLHSKKQNHYVKWKKYVFMSLCLKNHFTTFNFQFSIFSPKAQRPSVLNFSLLSVLAFGDVFADREVALVAALGDEVLVEGFEDGATWLVCVRAVAETALFGDAENFREVVRNLVEFHIYHTETFDARGVDEIRLFVDGIHLAEGGGVHTFVVIVRYLSCASMRIGHYLVDNSAFANARISREEGDFALEEFVEAVDANALSSRDLECVVTN